jgi:hypothetical protein
VLRARTATLKPGLALLLLLPAPLRAQDTDPLQRRGPFEAREEWLLAQRRLTLPAASADPLPRGSWQLRADLDWGNDFAHHFGSYFVDGEHRAFALALRRGLTDSLSVGVRLPLLWRGGGFLDWFADQIHKLGFPDNQRPLFPRNQLTVWALDLDGYPILWSDQPGTGLGKLELEAKLVPLRRVESRVTLAVAGRVALPTSTGPFQGGGVEGGAQLLASIGLSRRFDLHLGLGVAFGPRRDQGFEYDVARGFGHFALEWRFARTWSGLAQADGGSRTMTNVLDYPGFQSYLRLGAKHDLGSRTMLEGAFTENIKYQQATTDFGLYFGLVRRF